MRSDPTTTALLAEALAGHRLRRREARSLAGALRGVLDALPVAPGALDAPLRRRLAGAADVLDAQAARRRFRRR